MTFHFYRRKSFLRVNKTCLHIRLMNRYQKFCSFVVLQLEIKKVLDTTSKSQHFLSQAEPTQYTLLENINCNDILVMPFDVIGGQALLLYGQPNLLKIGMSKYFQGCISLYL